MTFTKEQNTHHLKIYPEHFSAVLTGVKRAELRKNDRNFKVGDTLHLMETPKGSCNPTGEFVNAVVTHIADVGDWLPGYVLLSIEREPAHTAPPAPVVPKTSAVESLATDLMKRIDKITGERHSIATLSSLRVSIVEACRAARLQGAEPSKTGLTLREGLAAIRNSGIAIDAGKIQAERDALNAPAIPDGYALVPVEPTESMIIAGFEAELREEFRDPDAWEAYEAMSDCEQAALRAKWCWAAMVAAAPQQEA